MRLVLLVFFVGGVVVADIGVPNVTEVNVSWQRPAIEKPAEGCECISDLTHLLGILNASDTAFLTDPFSSSNPCDGAMSEANGVECILSEEYGLGECKEHDLGELSSCKNTLNLPPYCTREWCFVDPNNCSTRPHEPSKFKFNGIPMTEAVSYSYQTCNEVDKWTNAKDFSNGAYERLRGRTLRVGVPIPNTETKYLQKGGLDPKGPMWEFMEFIAEEVNMTLNLQIISQESIDKAEQNHNWWGCIHEVATNVTDICIGDFWASPSRRAYMSPVGTFTAAMGTADFYFVTKLGDETKVGGNDKFTHPLKPFNGELRWILLIVWLTTSFVYVNVERIAHFRRKSIREEKFFGSKIRTSKEATEIEVDSERENKDWFHEAPLHKVYINQVYWFFHALREVSFLRPTASWPGRFICFSFGIFLMVLYTYWCAFITAQMVTGASNFNNRQSLKEASEAGEKICAYGWVGEELRDKKREPNINLKQTGEFWSKETVSALISTRSAERGNLDVTLKGTLDAVLQGYCEHTIMDLDMLEGFYLTEMEQQDADKYCGRSMGYLGGSLLARTDISFPVNAEIEPEISFMMRYHITKFNELLKGWEQTNPVPELCKGSLIMRNKSEAGLLQISVSKVIVELVMLVFSCFVAYVFAWFIPSRVPERKK